MNIENAVIEKQDLHADCPESVVVYLDHDTEVPIGKADITFKDDGILADFDLDDAVLNKVAPKRPLTLWPSCAFKKDGDKVELIHVALCCQPNIDATIEPIILT